ncbi:uncharacterized protein GGS22DRAFT_93496 [Annulohypoxylon maeteangense]|uniref:uncharacterized protein n=1 Tax=Annulohypoxylon maeteangense TaxID=1927788 RepID=UPI0020089FDD|nr:uncharacterized protein GGS22DRAFT_93496 [Annulohypoxylon maeteangense]KAI0888133.1 hypothetical protein GGS22DRAFT_93496 [Annulohypoxylon maeteangense]
MDCQCADTSFIPEDFRVFKYESRPFKIIMKLWSKVEPKCWYIESSRALREWIENNKAVYETCEDGTIAILFSRGGDKFYSNPSNLPVSKEDFSELIEVFHIHRTIARTICREIAYFSSMWLCTEGPDVDNLVYTARMSPDWANDIAVSSTYLVHRRLNLSVFYGCSQDQSFEIESRIARARGSVYHPILAPGILVELDRSRLVGEVELVTDSLVLTMQKLSRTTRDPKAIMDLGKSHEELSDLYNDSMQLVKGIGKVKRYISDIYNHTRDLNEAFDNTRRKKKPRRKLSFDDKAYSRFEVYPTLPNTGGHICERLLEIDAEYDEKLDQCHSIPKNLIFETQMAADFANIRISVESRQENSQMRSIALVTMVYLPLTSVASIFSMGVFNWNVNEEKSVLTFYFWVYVAIGGGLTLVTIGLWWYLTRTRRREGDVENLT